MWVINTVDELAQLSSTPDPKPTQYQELLKAVISIWVLVGAIKSDNTVGLFTARSKCTFTLREKVGEQVDANAQNRQIQPLSAS